MIKGPKSYRMSWYYYIGIIIWMARSNLASILRVVCKNRLSQGRPPANVVLGDEGGTTEGIF
jgi:hypothetical protein